MSKSIDFEYDGLRLSDFGFLVCKFDSGGVETVSNGSEISFNTVTTMRGVKHDLTSAEYEDYLTATLQICKDYCDYGGSEEISVETMRDIMRWLNRKEFHKFKLLDPEYSGIYFMGSFNVSKIEIDGRLYGFELELITNRPFALHEPVTHILEIDTANEVNSIYSLSDEEGYIYPDMEITVNSDGDLDIYNSLEDRVMHIANCKKNEVITVNYPMITSSLSSHKILNDFNFIFFRIATTFKNRLNDVTVSIPCTIKMTYSPIVKVGI